MFTEEIYGAVTVLRPENGGVVPYGNSVVVKGADLTAIIDPSLALDDDPVGADLAVISHAHEDHIAGLRHISAPAYTHDRETEALASLEVMLAQYGLEPEVLAVLKTSVREQYQIPDTREDVGGVSDEHVFDLGGGRTMTLVHLPGHTPGHSGVLIEPDGFFYVADIDLTSFGPMYADLQSSVDDFLASIERAGTVDARWYGTFHQKGVIEGSTDFRRRLAAYRDKLLSREDRLVAFLDEPRARADIVGHRLVYRPHVRAPWVTAVERRTAQLHLERLMYAGQVTVDAEGRYRRSH